MNKININTHKGHGNQAKDITVCAEDLNMNRYYPEKKYNFSGREKQIITHHWVIKDRVYDCLVLAKTFDTFDECSEKMWTLNFDYWKYRAGCFLPIVQEQMSSKAKALRKALKESNQDKANSLISELQVLSQMNLNLHYQGLTCAECNESRDVDEDDREVCECTRECDKLYS